MRILITVILAANLLWGCQQNQDGQLVDDPQAEAEEVEATLMEFFDAISSYDYQTLRDIAAEDYVLIENGPIWTIDSLITVVKQFEDQTTISYEFSDMETTVEGRIAWMIYKNSGLMKMPDGERHYDWTESAVFRKQGNEWKMVLLHSTVNDTD